MHEDLKLLNKPQNHIQTRIASASNKKLFGFDSEKRGNTISVYSYH